jgi:hypothetical protein
MFVNLLLILISVSAGFFEKSHFENEKPAIVFAEATTLKLEPKPLAKEIMKLHEGTKVFVKVTLNNYKKVQLTDQTEGWIESNDIKEVK